MSVEPIEKSRSTGCLKANSTSLVISKETGVTLVHPDGEKLPENCKYEKTKKLSGGYITK